MNLHLHLQLKVSLLRLGFCNMTKTGNAIPLKQVQF